MVEVTGDRYMPPWLPLPGYGRFSDARVLTLDQISLIRQWAEEGAPEGLAVDMPPPPEWNDQWFLGTPDRIVRMPEVFTLKPDGDDVYRNFVIPVAVEGPRYVNAVEFRPDNAGIVHHAFIRIDRTPASQIADEADPNPGFDGIHAPISAQSPEGHFLGWQPGKVPRRARKGLAWVLEKGTDIVLQMHMRPTGKPESIQASIGLYFTDDAPSRNLSKIRLTSFDIDIPAGEKAFAIEDSYVIPVDMRVLSVLPHAHYLGREIHGLARLPDGSEKWLLRIDNWDFNWQGDYRLAEPLFLPGGTTLSMKIVYDNSDKNVRNPNHPPLPVRYGLRSSDEMAELWFQVELKDQAALTTFASDYQYKVAKDIVAYNSYLLRLDAGDAKAHSEIGKGYSVLGKDTEAEEHFRRSIKIDGTKDEPHYFLGVLFRGQKRFSDAKAQFESAIRLNPNNSRAYGNLGLMFLERGFLDDAERAFREALRIDPNDAIARGSLEDVGKAASVKRDAGRD